MNPARNGLAFRHGVFLQYPSGQHTFLAPTPKAMVST